MAKLQQLIMYFRKNELDLHGNRLHLNEQIIWQSNKENIFFIRLKQRPI